MVFNKIWFQRSLVASLVLNVILSVILASQRIPSPRPSPSAARVDEASGFELMPDKTGSRIFLGDSLTAEGPFGELFGNFLNRGVKGDTTNGVYARLGEIIRHNPCEVSLMIGINDLMRGAEPESVASGIAAITRTLIKELPATRIRVFALLPVDESRFGKLVTNEKILETNKEIHQTISDLDVDFIDFHDLFIGIGCGLDPRLTYDGIHLSAEGYLLWRNNLVEKELE